MPGGPGSCRPFIGRPLPAPWDPGTRCPCQSAGRSQQPGFPKTCHRSLQTVQLLGSILFPGQTPDHATPASEMETLPHVGQHTVGLDGTPSPLGDALAASFSLVSDKVVGRRHRRGQSTAGWLFPPGMVGERPRESAGYSQSTPSQAARPGTFSWHAHNSCTREPG